MSTKFKKVYIVYQRWLRNNYTLEIAVVCCGNKTQENNKKYEKGMHIYEGLPCKIGLNIVKLNQFLLL